ncbi:hypothetical protein CCHL11_03078 [Colletotrichum chlorophyti]|uniref:Uncharacterized protein n=1 Tax=Colletotrichum chlorophyti TaxID=708187 RepID=A0A1Q8RGB8_9PEZI|nr:hypothetical protein CCHL11_03078 [Colletotrichum chlorophyti]
MKTIPDNLDELDQRLLDGRKVLTTVDGTAKLEPHSNVFGVKSWQEIEELSRLEDMYHIQVALLNRGGAALEMPG